MRLGSIRRVICVICGADGFIRGSESLAQSAFDIKAIDPETSEKTEFRVLYDDTTLFLGVWVWDSDAAGIPASEMKRDAGLNKGDQIKITIDTFHDHRNAFYFSTNPLGAYKDANTVENGSLWQNKVRYLTGTVRRATLPADPVAQAIAVLSQRLRENPLPQRR